MLRLSQRQSFSALSVRWRRSSARLLLLLESDRLRVWFGSLSLTSSVFPCLCKVLVFFREKILEARDSSLDLIRSVKTSCSSNCNKSKLGEILSNQIRLWKKGQSTRHGSTESNCGSRNLRRKNSDSFLEVLVLLLLLLKSRWAHRQQQAQQPSKQQRRRRRWRRQLKQRRRSR